MEKVIASILVLGTLLAARDRVDDDKGSFYVTTNPVAPVVQIPGYDAKIVIPFFSNFEYGLSVTGGYLLTPSQSVDAELVLGSSDQISFTPQSRRLQLLPARPVQPHQQGTLSRRGHKVLGHLERLN